MDAAAEAAAMKGRLPGPDAAAPALGAVVREVASGIRRMAGINRHRVEVRVIERQNTVRMTIVGTAAPRYRAIARDELERRLPGATAEIRAQVRGRTM